MFCKYTFKPPLCFLQLSGVCDCVMVCEWICDGLQAEKANGRAAMVGYFLAYFVDSWTGAGLYDQQNSFLGKLALHLVVFAILIFRSSDSLASLKNLLDEATFYDKQWQANWLNTERPKEED